MEDMGPHVARHNPGKVKLSVRKCDNQTNYEVKELRVMMPRLKKCRFCGLLGCGKPHYEVKELRVMMPRLKKCRFCGLLGCGKPHDEFLVRPCKVMMPMLKNCTFCGVLGCDQVTPDWCELTDSE